VAYVAEGSFFPDVGGHDLGKYRIWILAASFFKMSTEKEASTTYTSEGSSSSPEGKQDVPTHDQLMTEFAMEQLKAITPEIRRAFFASQDFIDLGSASERVCAIMRTMLRARGYKTRTVTTLHEPPVTALRVYLHISPEGDRTVDENGVLKPEFHIPPRAAAKKAAKK
jgi:hypothetical protein